MYINPDILDNLTTLGQVIIARPPVDKHCLSVIGASRKGTQIGALRIGSGDINISLISGCHADEPVGARLLRSLCSLLYSMSPDDPVLKTFTWWVVAHANPDGEKSNQDWADSSRDCYDLFKYLKYSNRELPGEDMEFGFPRGADDNNARPENMAIYKWWQGNSDPFHLHVSLHGMGFSGGAWYLIDPQWAQRCAVLMSQCVNFTHKLHYPLHDVQRHGEKGFKRIARGFCTRPGCEAMKEYFLKLGDKGTAGLFRPSSMDIMRSKGADTLTLVSEIPLFITKGAGEDIGPPDIAAEMWKAKIDEWRQSINQNMGEAQLNKEFIQSGIRPVPIIDQLKLQWNFIIAGLRCLATEI